MSFLRLPRYHRKSNGYVLQTDGGESDFYREYVYQPLSSPKAIRLIKLSSRRNRTTWKYFTIEDHSIDEPGLKYTAVSYTWGDDSTAVPIILDSGIEASVQLTTPNAWEAVHTLVTDSWLWIDQICINQKDFAEKDVQIGLMNEIYSRCAECVIWLGSEDEYTAGAFGLVRQLNASITSDEALPYQWHVLYNLPHEKIREMHRKYYKFDRLPPADDPGWVCYAHCLCRPWFQRLWTFQEAILPHMYRIRVRCGRFEATLYDFRRVAQFLGTWNLPGVPLMTGRKTLHQIANLQYRVRNNLPRSLYTLLGTTADQSCKVPNDRVYALLGLRLEEVPVEPITVNTEIATEKLYADTTKRIIASDLSLLVCCSASIRQSGEVHNLPSWVPDWTGKRLTAVFETVCRPYFFSADQGRRVLTPSGEFSMQLTAKGDYVDKIIHIIPTDSPDNENVQVLSTYLYTILLHLFSTLKAPSNNNEIALMVRIAKTAIAGGFLQTKGLPKFDWTTQSVLKKLRCLFTPSHGALFPAADFSDWLQNFSIQARICQFRRFAILEQWHLALVPRHAREGDRIAILHGCSLPVVLRACVGDEVQLIGPCFVDGLMHGDGVTWAEDDAHIFRII